MQPIPPAELIRQIATALYGAGFQHELAAVLGVNRTSVRRWTMGTVEPREGVWAELLELMQERREQLGELIKIVAARIEPGAR